MKTRTRRIARRVLGRYYTRAQNVLLTRRRRALHGDQTDSIVEQYVSAHGLEVRRGPFAGARFPPEAVNSGYGLVPKLVGSYECELHDAFEHAIRARPDVVVNIGAGDGFYAIGLARRLPSANVYAFELDSSLGAVLEQMAETNQVASRVVLEAACTVRRLQKVPWGRSPLVVCDCESCELDVLQPDQVPQLRRAAIIVELHNFIEPTISRRILARFAGTHSSCLIDTRERDPGLYPELEALLPPARERALDEGRPGAMRWAVLRPLQEHGS